ncbi:MAG TPA: hypothetical protein VMT53_02830 [Terriglobales bacterium]|nr:hypothetical protein [Terriglobales bacterium]
MFSSKIQARWQVSHRIGFVLLLILALGLSVCAQTAPKSKKQKPKAAKVVESQAPETAAATSTPPAPPPTPEQMPPRPPTVTYQNGQLSIVAPNSTLSDILQAVKTKTGATIDVPAGANERVMSRFGPGPARDVLAALLNGSHFNYVMIGSDANPASVAQVILTPRIGGETGPVNQANGAMPNPGAPQYSGQVMRPQPYPGGQVVYQQPPVPAAEDAPPADSEQDDTAAQQENGDGTDEGAPEQANETADGQDNGQPQVKTPEQLLQELQRQQQIQQQRQGGQPGQPVPPLSPPPQPQ